LRWGDSRFAAEILALISYGITSVRITRTELIKIGFSSPTGMRSPMGAMAISFIWRLIDSYDRLAVADRD